MDLTWTFYEYGWKVRFIPEAVSYPIEPHNAHFLAKQLKRWSHGFVQNVRLHRQGVLAVPFLRHAVAVACWDAVIAAVAYLFLLPVLAVALGNPWLLLGYVIDVPAVAVPVLVGAAPRRETIRALVSLPSFFVVRTVNAMFFLKAVWMELVMKRSFTTYEKGH
jgi:biofilm PGA synthesis N-glycosyltransferase PgaC